MCILLKDGIRRFPPGGWPRDFRCGHPDRAALSKLVALVECYERNNKDEMRKLGLVKNLINEAAIYTNFVVIESRAIHARLLAMPVEMDWRFRPRQATNPAVTID
jgi:hypothetical protein